MVSDLSVGEELCNSDYKLVRFAVNIPETQDVQNMNMKIYIRHADFSGLRSAVSDTVVEEGGEIDDLWNSFKNNFMEVQSRFIPLIRPILNSRAPKWLTHNI